MRLQRVATSAVAAAGLLLGGADEQPGEGLPDRALRVGIAAALAVISDYSGTVWPASPDAPTQMLLVLQDQEYLFCPEPAVAAALEGEGFASLGRDPVSGCDLAARPRRLPPNLLATFPAVAGISTVVIGSPAATGRTIEDWAATLLHEHVHQMQASMPGYARGTAALDLANGDETGQWMLDYPFPYEAAAAEFRDLADAAIAALAAEEEDFVSALEGYAGRRRAFLEALAPKDARYLEFQLWQEGVARWSEQALIRAAGRRWPYDGAWIDRHAARHAQELRQAELAMDGRVAFYALGAAEAGLLERLGPEWRERYLNEPFALGPYFP
jgi:hypothetical protein